MLKRVQPLVPRICTNILMYGLLNDVASISCCRLVEWLTKNELEIMCKEAIIIWYQLLSWNSPAETEWNQESPRCPTDTGAGSALNIPEALSLEPFYCGWLSSEPYEFRPYPHDRLKILFIIILVLKYLFTLFLSAVGPVDGLLLNALYGMK
jgi:hypothetical protein